MNSKKTLAVFNEIKRSQDEYGWSPSLTEIAQETGMTKPACIGHLHALRDLNIIKLGSKSLQISINPKDQWKTNQ